MISEYFIRNIRLLPDAANNAGYPFDVPAVQALDALTFEQPITFLIGENGSGKSTIIEALALAAGFNAEGGTKNYSFESFDTTSTLAKHVQLVRGVKREKFGYFLRAETFYNAATNFDATGMSYNGEKIHNRSHGESFMMVANYRFEPHGLYIFDEPEAALSPRRQLALMLKIHELIGGGSQFVIATHSPILLAYPKAKIYELNDDGITEVEYEATDQYKLSKDFLNNHEAYVARLFNEDDNSDGS